MTKKEVQEIKGHFDESTAEVRAHFNNLKTHFDERTAEVKTHVDQKTADTLVSG